MVIAGIMLKSAATTPDNIISDSTDRNSDPQSEEDGTEDDLLHSSRGK